MIFMASRILVGSAMVGSGASSQDSTAQETAAVARAQEAATIWLALVDADDYAQGGEQSAAPFQVGILKTKWTTTAGVVRSSYGALK